MAVPSHLRRPRGRSLVAATLGAVLALAVSGCAATTFDESLATTATTAAATTTTLPTGTAAELLPRLVDEAASLSGVMIDEGDDRAVAERITALWDAAKPEVARTRLDLIASFDAAVALVQKAVDFSRAADADKASKNIVALVDAYLSV